MARVLIAGCGYLGEALAARLLGAGHAVWALRRPGGRFPEGAAPLPADLQDISSLSPIPDDLDFVFYTAGADTRTDEGYRQAYVTGLGNLLSHLEKAGSPPQRVFFTSSTAVYGQTQGEWVDEDTPVAPSLFTGVRLLEGERLLKNSPLPATTIRLAGIYGPGRTRLLTAVREGRAALREGPTRYVNRIHRDDAAGLLSHLMALPAPENLYIGADHLPAGENEVLRWIGEQMGAGALPAATSEKDTGRGATSNKRCRNERALRSGYTFHYPTYREGYGALMKLG